MAKAWLELCFFAKDVMLQHSAVHFFQVWFQSLPIHVNRVFELLGDSNEHSPIIPFNLFYVIQRLLNLFINPFFDILHVLL